MGNTRSARFEVDHRADERNQTRRLSKPRFSFSEETDNEHFRKYSDPHGQNMYTAVYAESSVSESSSKESETMSTLSTTSTSDNISVSERYKTAPPRMSHSGIEADISVDTRKGHKKTDSFFDEIFAKIEEEAGKKSPSLSRRSTNSMGKKQRWSGMLS